MPGRTRSIVASQAASLYPCFGTGPPLNLLTAVVKDCLTSRVPSVTTKQNDFADAYGLLMPADPEAGSATVRKRTRNEEDFLPYVRLPNAQRLHGTHFGALGRQALLVRRIRQGIRAARPPHEAPLGALGRQFLLVRRMRQGISHSLATSRRTFRTISGTEQDKRPARFPTYMYIAYSCGAPTRAPRTLLAAQPPAPPPDARAARHTRRASSATRSRSARAGARGSSSCVSSWL